MNEDDDLLLLEWEDDSSLLFSDFGDVTSSLKPSIDSQNINQISQVSTKREQFLNQIDEDLDYAFALALQTQYEEEKENVIFDSKKPFTRDSPSSKPLSIVDEQWELIDPHPDIHVLFQEYDLKFFYGKLKQVEVKWSPRMTLCAGVCSYEGRGGLCSIRLSEPLLKLRPRKDLVETLLHEMIHAYLFVTHNNKDHNAHGPEFLNHMNRINKESGTRITVYHSFHDEVDLYRQHWWKCNGPCKDRRPYYGLLKRAQNRAPCPKDNWWADHQANCGGTFIKIKEPDNYGKKTAAKRKATSECGGSPSDIRNFFKHGTSQSDKNRSMPSAVKSNISHLESSLVKENSIATLNSESTSKRKLFVPFQGTGHKLGGSSDGLNVIPSHFKENSLNKAVAFPSSSEKALDVTPHSNVAKIPRLTNSEKNVYKDQKPSTSVISNSATKNFVQGSIEKFFSSKIVSKEKNSGEKHSFINVQKSDVLKVSCPVCFILVKEQEINSHLDACLST